MCKIYVHDNNKLIRYDQEGQLKEFPCDMGIVG